MSGMLDEASSGDWKTTKRTKGGGSGGSYGSDDPFTVNGYDRGEVKSALQKAIRRGQEELALYWGLRDVGLEHGV